MMECNFIPQVTFGQHFIIATETQPRKGVKAVKWPISCPKLRDPAVEVNCNNKGITEHLSGPRIKSVGDWV